MRLVLASASPRRAELLTAAGYSFDTLVVDVDERARPGETPVAYVRRVAMDKSARALEILTSGPAKRSGASRTDACSSEPGMPVSGSPEGGHYARGGVGQGVPGGVGHDTGGGVGHERTAHGGDAGLVVLGADTAVVVDGDILGKPRDDDHAREMLRRLSGRAHEVMTGISIRSPLTEAGLVEITTVWFSSLTPEAAAWYVATGEGRDKAGAYAIQGLASRFVPRIEGSYANVVGLPIAGVAETLSRLATAPRTRDTSG
jgi:MAF protein